jgi:histone-lysine N-methyltransferase SETMAR
MSVEVTSEEWRAVIRFCVLLGYSNEHMRCLLRDGYGDSAPSKATGNRWARLFRGGSAAIADAPRTGRPPTSEGLAEVILGKLDEQPFMCLRVLAETLCYSKETVRRCLHTELGYKKYVSKWVPHQLSEGQKEERVAAAHEMLRQLTCKRRIDFVTADESWFRHKYFHEGQWAAAAEDVGERVKEAFTPKTMVVIVWSVRGFHIVESLPAGETFTGGYAASLLHRFDDSMRESRPAMGARGMTLHWDNARPHRSAEAAGAIREIRMLEMPHPPYSPDLSPCDFFLFGEIKPKLKGRSFLDSGEVLTAIKAETESITRETRERVFDEWVRRLECVIESGGDYVVN